MLGRVDFVSQMPLEVTQVRDALQNEFGGLIDMSDLQGPPETLARAFLSRALAALVTQKLLGCDHRTAADAVVDGRDDNGIDAIAVTETGTRIWLIQSKWSDQGTARFRADDALKFSAGLKLLDDQHFDRFNLKLQKHAEVTRAAWGNPALRVTIVVAVMGDAPSPGVVRHFDDLAQEWNGHSKFLDYQVFDAKKIWQIVQDDLAAELPPVARFLAGVQSDSPSDADRLGISDDVRTLAELIMARETSPPLAIAIIGDWGVGKSSLMVQVEAAVAKLAASTQAVREDGQSAESDGERSAFLENVRQVRFNAWHYSDEHLWHGLATKLFEELGTADGKDSRDIGGSSSAKTRAERKDLAADQERLEHQVQALESGPLAGTAPGLAAWLRHPVATGRLTAEVLRGSPSGPRAWASVLLGAALTAILWAVVAVLADWGWQEFSVWLRSLVVVAAVAAPSGGWISYLRASQRTFAARLKKGHDMVQRVHQQKQQELERVKKQRALHDAEARLSQFLVDQADGTGYAKYQGLLGQVRGDLETLSRALADARYQWEQDGGNKEPPLQRTILYIDDLDRCPPRRVVAVLEAVHLMLALDLFIVMVAVDARWLIRSLDYHYRELFRTGNDRQAAAEPLGDDGGPAANGTAAAGSMVPQSAAAPQDDAGGPSAATPVEYLDKIFQIPFAVARPQPDAIADYLRSLLPDPVASPEADAPPESEGDREGELAVPAPGQSAIGEQGGRRRRENRGGTPTAAADANGAPSIEPYPEGLKLSRAEVHFMGTLWPLLPTPRAAKRLVNLYRLVRIGVPTAELDEFAGDVNGGPYRAVQVLLAILVGHPEFAERLFKAAMTGSPQGDLGQLAAHIKSQGGGSRSCEVVCDFLATFSGQEHVAVNLELARRWCPVLARFSFYTHDLAHPRAREFTA